jgi:hypothetical protein
LPPDTSGAIPLRPSLRTCIGVPSPSEARLIAAIGYPGLAELMATVMLYVVTARTTNVAG